MFEGLRGHYLFHLVHGRFTALKNKIEMVKQWPGVDPRQVDEALERASADGTLDGYRAESPTNKHLDVVVSVYRETPGATLRYWLQRVEDARERGGLRLHASDITSMFMNGLREDDVLLLPDGATFAPNRIVIEVVDFAVRCGATSFDRVKDVGPNVASFAALYNLVQSPEWVRQIEIGDASAFVVRGLAIRYRGDLELVGVRHGGAKPAETIWKVCRAGQHWGLAVPMLRTYPYPT